MMPRPRFAFLAFPAIVLPWLLTACTAAPTPPAAPPPAADDAPAMSSMPAAPTPVPVTTPPPRGAEGFAPPAPAAAGSAAPVATAATDDRPSGVVLKVGGQEVPVPTNYDDRGHGIGGPAGGRTTVQLYTWQIGTLPEVGQVRVDLELLAKTAFPAAYGTADVAEVEIAVRRMYDKPGAWGNKAWTTYSAKVPADDAGLTLAVEPDLVEGAYAGVLTKVEGAEADPASIDAELTFVFRR
jgi:hypothetical protein